MAKSLHGQFVPINRAKYMGPNINAIEYRSSWEQKVMMLVDSHPNILGWSYESIRIPYFNPFSRQGNRIGGYTFYVPDFFVIYTDKNNLEHREIIEVKPQKELPGYIGKVNKLTESRQALNLLKWNAAMKFCAARNWQFRVATERELFKL